MKFRVGLTQTVVEEATVIVEASSRDEAEDRALDLAALEGSRVNWRFLMTTGEIEIATLDELPGETK